MNEQHKNAQAAYRRPDDCGAVQGSPSPQTPTCDIPGKIPSSLRDRILSKMSGIERKYTKMGEVITILERHPEFEDFLRLQELLSNEDVKY